MNEYVESQAIDLWREVFRAERGNLTETEAAVFANQAVDEFLAKFQGTAPKE